jgi:hypothetical protein
MTKEYLKTNRTPFELRTDLLKIAQDYLEKQYNANMELYRATMQSLQQDAVALQSDLRTELPKYFDFQDIITKAQELYGFVQKRD